MAGKFELKIARNGKYHFNLLASNGQIILSSEMYETRAAAENGITSVRKNSPNDNHFVRLTSTQGHPYFVLKADNGQIIGRSELYYSSSALENGIDAVKSMGSNAEHSLKS